MWAGFLGLCRRESRYQMFVSCGVAGRDGSILNPLQLRWFPLSLVARSRKAAP
jgi:hypothetical protein